MFGDDQFLEGCQPGGCGLDDEQEFGAAIEFSLPPVVGLHAADNVHTGCELSLQDFFRELARDFDVRNGDERERNVAS